MKLSFTTMATPELSVPEQAQAVKRFGFDAVDLRMIERGAGEIPKDATEEQLQQIKGQAGPVSSILCYNTRIDSGAKEMAASVCRHLEIAASLSVPAIRIFTGLIHDGQEKEICQVLEQALTDGPEGVDIVIQNHRNICTTVDQATTICKMLNTDRVGIALSPDHAMVTGEEIRMDTVLPYVKQLYIAGDEKMNVGVPSGKVLEGYDSIIRQLLDHPFDGYMTFKWERCWRGQLANYETVFPQFMDWIKTYQQ